MAINGSKASASGIIGAAQQATGATADFYVVGHATTLWTAGYVNLEEQHPGSSTWHKVVGISSKPDGSAKINKVIVTPDIAVEYRIFTYGITGTVYGYFGPSA